MEFPPLFAETVRLSKNDFELLFLFHAAIAKYRYPPYTTEVDALKPDEEIKKLLEIALEKLPQDMPKDEARMLQMGLYGLAAGTTNSGTATTNLLREALTEGIIHEAEWGGLAALSTLLGLAYNDRERLERGSTKPSYETEARSYVDDMQGIAGLQVDFGLSPQPAILATLMLGAGSTRSSELSQELFFEAYLQTAC
jgi:hypothetical protein